MTGYRSKRIHMRLCEKYPDIYTASYRTLAKFVAKVKLELSIGKEEFLQLSHSKKEAQVDFGKVTFFEKGKKYREAT